MPVDCTFWTNTYRSLHLSQYILALVYFIPRGFLVRIENVLTERSKTGNRLSDLTVYYSVKSKQLRQRNINNIQIGDEVRAPMVVKLTMTGSLNDFYCHILDETGNFSRLTKRPPLFIGTVPPIRTAGLFDHVNKDQCGDYEDKKPSNFGPQASSQKRVSCDSCAREAELTENGRQDDFRCTSQKKAHIIHSFSGPQDKLRNMKICDIPGTRAHRWNSLGEANCIRVARNVPGESKFHGGCQTSRRTTTADNRRRLHVKSKLAVGEPHYAKSTVAFNQMVYVRQTERLMKSNSAHNLPFESRHHRRISTSPHIRIAPRSTEARMLLRRRCPCCEVCAHRECFRATKDTIHPSKPPGTIQDTGEIIDTGWREEEQPCDFKYCSNSKSEVNFCESLPYLFPTAKLAGDRKRTDLGATDPQNTFMNIDSNIQTMHQHRELQTVNSYPSGPFYSIQGSKLLKMANYPSHPLRSDRTRSASMIRERETGLNKSLAKIHVSGPTPANGKHETVELKDDKFSKLASGARPVKNKLEIGMNLCSIKPENISYLEETVHARRRPATELEIGPWQPLLRTPQSSKEWLPWEKSNQVLRKTMVAGVEEQQSVFRTQGPMSLHSNIGGEQSHFGDERSHEDDVFYKKHRIWTQEDVRKPYRQSVGEASDVKIKDQISSLKINTNYLTGSAKSGDQKLIWDQGNKDSFRSVKGKIGTHENAPKSFGIPRCRSNDNLVNLTTQNDYSGRMSNNVPTGTVPVVELSTGSAECKVRSEVLKTLDCLTDQSESNLMVNNITHTVPQIIPPTLERAEFRESSKLSSLSASDLGSVQKGSASQSSRKKESSSISKHCKVANSSLNDEGLVNQYEEEAILSVELDVLPSVLTNEINQGVAEVPDSKTKDDLLPQSDKPTVNRTKTEGPIKRRNHLNILLVKSRGNANTEHVSGSRFSHRSGPRETEASSCVTVESRFSASQDHSLLGTDGVHEITSSFEHTSSTSLSFLSPTPSSEESLHLLNDTTLDGASQISSVFVHSKQTESPSNGFLAIRPVLYSCNGSKHDPQKLIDQNGILSSSDQQRKGYKIPKNTLLETNKSTLNFATDQVCDFDCIEQSLFEPSTWSQTDIDKQITNTGRRVEGPNQLFLCTTVGPIFVPRRSEMEVILSSQTASSQKSVSMSPKEESKSQWSAHVSLRIKTFASNLLQQVVRCWSYQTIHSVDSRISHSFHRTLRALFTIAGARSSLYDTLQVLNWYFRTEIQGILANNVPLSSGHARIFSRFTRPRWLDQNSKEIWYSLAQKSEPVIQIEWMALHTIFALAQRLLANKGNLIYRRVVGGSRFAETSVFWEQCLGKYRGGKCGDQLKKQTNSMYTFVIRWLFKKSGLSGRQHNTPTQRSFKTAVSVQSALKRSLPCSPTSFSHDRITRRFLANPPERDHFLCTTKSETNHEIQNTQCFIESKHSSKGDDPVAQPPKIAIIGPQQGIQSGDRYGDTRGSLGVEQELALLHTETYYHSTSEETGSIGCRPQVDSLNKTKGDERYLMASNIDLTSSDLRRKPNKELSPDELAILRPVDRVSSTEVQYLSDRVPKNTVQHPSLKPSVSEKYSEYHTYQEINETVHPGKYIGIPPSIDRVEIEYRHENGGDISMPSLIVDQPFRVSHKRSSTLSPNPIHEDTPNQQVENLLSDSDFDSMGTHRSPSGFNALNAVKAKLSQTPHQNVQNYSVRQLMNSQVKPKVKTVGCSPSSWLELYSVNFVSTCENDVPHRSRGIQGEQHIFRKSTEVKLTKNKLDFKKNTGLAANISIPMTLNHHNYQDRNQDKLTAQLRSTSFDPIGSTEHGIDTIHNTVSHITSHPDEDWTAIVSPQALNNDVEMPVRSAWQSNPNEEQLNSCNQHISLRIQSLDGSFSDHFRTQSTVPKPHHDSKIKEVNRYHAPNHGVTEADSFFTERNRMFVHSPSRAHQFLSDHRQYPSVDRIRGRLSHSIDTFGLRKFFKSTNSWSVFNTSLVEKKNRNSLKTSFSPNVHDSTSRQQLEVPSDNLSFKTNLADSQTSHTIKNESLEKPCKLRPTKNFSHLDHKRQHESPVGLKGSPVISRFSKHSHQFSELYNHDARNRISTRGFFPLGRQQTENSEFPTVNEEESVTQILTSACTNYRLTKVRAAVRNHCWASAKQTNISEETSDDRQTPFRSIPFVSTQNNASNCSNISSDNKPKHSRARRMPHSVLPCTPTVRALYERLTRDCNHRRNCDPSLSTSRLASGLKMEPRNESRHLTETGDGCEARNKTNRNFTDCHFHKLHFLISPGFDSSQQREDTVWPSNSHLTCHDTGSSTVSYRGSVIQSKMTFSRTSVSTKGRNKRRNSPFSMRNITVTDKSESRSCWSATQLNVEEGPTDSPSTLFLDMQYETGLQEKQTPMQCFLVSKEQNYTAKQADLTVLRTFCITEITHENAQNTDSHVNSTNFNMSPCVQLQCNAPVEPYPSAVNFSNKAKNSRESSEQKATFILLNLPCSLHSGQPVNYPSIDRFMNCISQIDSTGTVDNSIVNNLRHCVPSPDRCQQFSFIDSNHYLEHENRKRAPAKKCSCKAEVSSKVLPGSSFSRLIRHLVKGPEESGLNIHVPTSKSSFRNSTSSSSTSGSSHSENGTSTKSSSDHATLVVRRSASQKSFRVSEKSGGAHPSIFCSETDVEITKTCSKSTSLEKSVTESSSSSNESIKLGNFPGPQGTKTDKCYCNQLCRILLTACGCRYELVPDKTSDMKKCNKGNDVKCLFPFESCHLKQISGGCSCEASSRNRRPVTHADPELKLSKTHGHLPPIDDKKTSLLISGNSFNADRIIENLPKSHIRSKSNSIWEELLRIPSDQLPAREQSISPAKSRPVSQARFCYRHPTDPVSSTQSDPLRSLAKTISEEALQKAARTISNMTEQDSTGSESNKCKCEPIPFSCGCMITHPGVQNLEESPKVVLECCAGCSSPEKSENRCSICRSNCSKDEHVTEATQVTQTPDKHFATSQVLIKLSTGTVLSGTLIPTLDRCCTSRFSYVNTRHSSHSSGFAQERCVTALHKDSAKASPYMGPNIFRKVDSCTASTRIVSGEKNLKEIGPKLFKASSFVDRTQTVKTPFVSDAARRDRIHPYRTLPTIKQSDISKPGLEKTESYCVGYEIETGVEPKPPLCRPAPSLCPKLRKCSCVEEVDRQCQQHVKQATSQYQQTISSKPGIFTSRPCRTISCCTCLPDDPTLLMNAHQRAHHRMEEARTQNLQSGRIERVPGEITSKTSVNGNKTVESSKMEITCMKGQVKKQSGRIEICACNPLVPCNKTECLNSPSSCTSVTEKMDPLFRPCCTRKEHKRKSRNRILKGLSPLKKSRGPKRPRTAASQTCFHQGEAELFVDKLGPKTIACLADLSDCYIHLNKKVDQSGVSGLALLPSDCAPWCLMRDQICRSRDSGLYRRMTSSWPNHAACGCPLVQGCDQYPSNAKRSTVTKTSANFDRFAAHDCEKFVSESLKARNDRMCTCSQPTQFTCNETQYDLENGIARSRTSSHSESIKRTPEHVSTGKKNAKYRTRSCASLHSEVWPSAPLRVTNVDCQPIQKKCRCNQKAEILIPTVVSYPCSSGILLNRPVPEMVISKCTSSVTLNLSSNDGQVQCCTPTVQRPVLFCQSKSTDMLSCKCAKACHIKSCNRLCNESKVVHCSPCRSVSSCSSKMLSRTKSRTCVSSSLSRTQSLSYSPTTRCICSPSTRNVVAVSTRCSKPSQNLASRQRTASAPPIPRQTNPRSNRASEACIRYTKDSRLHKCACTVDDPISRCERKLSRPTVGLTVPDVLDCLKIRAQYLNDESSQRTCERETCIRMLARLHQQLERTAPIDLLACETWTRDDQTSKDIKPIPLSPTHLASLRSWVLPNEPSSTNPQCACRNPTLYDIAMGSSSTKKNETQKKSPRKDTFGRRARTVSGLKQICGNPDPGKCKCANSQSRANAEALCPGGCQLHLQKTQPDRFQYQRSLSCATPNSFINVPCNHICPGLEPLNAIIPGPPLFQMQNLEHTKKQCTSQRVMSCGRPCWTEQFPPNCNCPKRNTRDGSLGKSH
ncbi:hypothetical protein D915_009428 [Fasciola hepatica]|uniref:Uncharacterized protein n=1 Tax=Fasciola hepatica TaxID=6192 RepID=A0A4E0R1H5_FASHE|nr:hypothetical protein D915_009428 [Fasciola hepatica]